MGTFLQSLHVLAAVLLVGPLVFTPFAARRALGRRDAAAVRAATRQMALFGGGSVAVAVLGALTLITSDEHGFGAPWVVVSMTLYVVAVGLVYLYAVPALRSAARLVELGVVTGPAAGPQGDDEEAPEMPTLTATAEDLRAKEHLDATAGRLTLAGALVLLVFAVITIMMVVRPFTD